MKAIVVQEFGAPDVLALADLPMPAMAPGKLLVRVRAAAVNPLDWKLRAGYLKDFLPLKPPFTPGLDLAGTVEAVGDGVIGFVPGDEVFGKADFPSPAGSYAEYSVASPAALAPKPRTLDFAQAAAVPVAATTAWAALLADSGAALKAGQTVLIHAGAGGVGGFAIQLAKCCGARVIATGSAANADYLRELGADVVIDYTAQPFETVAGEVDVVLDTLAGDTQARSWALIRDGGVLVTLVGAPSIPDAAKARGVRGLGASGNAANARLGDIGQLIDDGVLKVTVAEVLPLAEAACAHALSQTGHVRGKLVLQVA